MAGKINFLKIIAATLLYAGSWSPEDMESSICWINYESSGLGPHNRGVGLLAMCAD